MVVIVIVVIVVIVIVVEEHTLLKQSQAGATKFVPWHATSFTCFSMRSATYEVA